MSDTQQGPFSLTIEEGDTIQEPSVGIFKNEQVQLDLVNYLSRELVEASSDAGREVRMERNKKIKRQRLTQPETEEKNWPWKNASNVTTPLALQKTNIVATKLQAAFMSKKPLFVYSSYNPAYKGHSEAITRHIQKQVESPYGIDLYRKLWPILYDAVSLGTEFVEVPFIVEQMKFSRISAEGGEEKVAQTVKASPDVIPIKFEDFLTRYQWEDIQKAPWIAIRRKLHSYEIRRLAQQGFYTDVEGVLSKSTQTNEHALSDMENMGVEPTGEQDSRNYPYEIFECYVRWDADGDGFDEDLIIHIDKGSHTILRAEYNDLGIRPVARLPYIDIPGQLYGLGVGDIMSSLQDEADTLHNMRNDGTQLAMMPFVITSESSSFGQSMELFPGKFMKAPVPREDVIVHKFPGVGPEAIQAESIVQQYADDATGANQSLSGQDVGGSNRIGAQGTQFLASQSNGYLDSIAVQMGFAVGEIGLQLLYQNVKNEQFLDLTMLSESDQTLCREVYSGGVENIPGTFQFTAKLAAIADSKQSKQQEAMGLFQVYVSYIDKMIQLGSSLANPELTAVPQVQESITTGYVGLTNLMKDMLKNYDEESLGDYLPFVRDMEASLRMADEQREMELEQVETSIAEEKTGMVQEPGTDQPDGDGSPDNAQGAGAGSMQGAGTPPPEQMPADIEPV